jgi:hypothetical protein
MTAWLHANPPLENGKVFAVRSRWQVQPGGLAEGGRSAQRGGRSQGNRVRWPSPSEGCRTSSLMSRPARWLERLAKSPPAILHRRQGRPFTAELAPTRLSPGQGLLSLLGPTILRRGRTCACKYVKDRRLLMSRQGHRLPGAPSQIPACDLPAGRFASVDPSFLRHLVACACFVSLFAPSPVSSLASCHGLLWTNPTPCLASGRSSCR